MSRNRKSRYQTQMVGGRARKARADLKARGDTQACYTCGKTLYADLPARHPQSITLGHITALADGGNPYDPANHAPQCPTCNYSHGARLGNSLRTGTPTPHTRTSWVSDDY